MFQAPEYTRTVSMRLSEVLADIGVDERIVLKRRRAYLLRESMLTKSDQVLDENISNYYFGSQSEGSTTLGLHSDEDLVICFDQINLIQDWADWEPGKMNSLMILDETVSHGYCMLQHLRYDAPLPYNDVPSEHFYKDRIGRILEKNTIISTAAAEVFEDGEKHGPAYTRDGVNGFIETDYVVAYPCKSWPLQARQWLDQQGVGQWPSDDMKRYCSNTGCFVVAVGSKGSENEELEWRISTSLTERCLMFNLSITQIRCYVLMKMILKEFIKPNFENTISSYMCKTVLFHCIANTNSNIWRDENLLVCLSFCLFVLYTRVLNENCPHFIIPGNNLMRGHISHECKPYILELLQYIINSEGRVLLEIKCDDLGERIQMKLNNNPCLFKTSDIISGKLLKPTAQVIADIILAGLNFIRNSNYEEAIQTILYLFELVSISKKCQGLDKTACRLLAPWFCTTLGSILASLNICWYNNIGAEALTWISLGLDTDVASSKLKLASMLYCIGDIQRAEIVLRYIEGNYDLNIVEPICSCHYHIQPLRRGVNAIFDNYNEEDIYHTTAFCVRFLPCEINCVPHELRHEMFRSTEEDLPFRGQDDVWMDLAVIDSLPYLYFLQYKTYSNLGRHEDKQRALSNLARTIDQEPEIGHRETALNLLGQCMEQEGRAVDALRYYLLSLNLRGRNNAAKLHVCRLFF
ncbi:uncharacterized protein LOC128553551 [Mercenaria mercenaria]|uniref:uncharacterized protein LOC128553551 n=1 Tax=Mercenaria mercenaria TaxID=6596 RepID=UPI00234FAD94|nr:uncharacterized protein LOC128553551 [Mercenaria mercenaria]